MIDIGRVKKYCNEDPKLIENYDKAILDDIQTWDCHHRFETNKNMSMQDLINNNLYYNRPANELIFLTKAEHHLLHIKGKNNPVYNMSPTKKDKWKEHISNTLKGRKQSEETKKKISESLKRKKYNLINNEKN